MNKKEPHSPGMVPSLTGFWQVFWLVLKPNGLPASIVVT